MASPPTPASPPGSPRTTPGSARSPPRPSRRAATRRSSRRSAPTSCACSSEMLARPERRGDLVRDLAYDVPTITILTLIGADLGMVDTYKRWSDSRAAMTWGDLSDEEQVPHAHNLVDYWAGVPAARRRGARDRARQPGRRPRPRAGRRRPDHRPRDRLHLLLPALRRPRDDDDADLQRAAGPARAPRAVAAGRRRPQPHPGAPIDEVLRYSGSIVGVAPTGAARRRDRGSGDPRGRRHPAADGLRQPRRGPLRGRPSPSTSPAPTPASTCPSASASTTAWATCWPSCRPGSRSRRSPGSHPACASPTDADIHFGDNLSFRAPVEVPVTWPRAVTMPDRPRGGLP